MRGHGPMITGGWLTGPAPMVAGLLLLGAAGWHYAILPRGLWPRGDTAAVMALGLVRLLAICAASWVGVLWGLVPARVPRTLVAAAGAALVGLVVLCALLLPEKDVWLSNLVAAAGMAVVGTLLARRPLGMGRAASAEMAWLAASSLAFAFHSPARAVLGGVRGGVVMVAHPLASGLYGGLTILAVLAVTLSWRHQLARRERSVRLLHLVLTVLLVVVAGLVGRGVLAQLRWRSAEELIGADLATVPSVLLGSTVGWLIGVLVAPFGLPERWRWVSLAAALELLVLGVGWHGPQQRLQMQFLPAWRVAWTETFAVPLLGGFLSQTNWSLPLPAAFALCLPLSWAAALSYIINMAPQAAGPAGAALGLALGTGGALAAALLLLGAMSRRFRGRGMPTAPERTEDATVEFGSV